MIPEVFIKSDHPSTEWIEKNIEKMMEQIMVDARYQRPLPLSINMHPIAYRKFANVLKSKSIFIPNDKGDFSFFGAPVKQNNQLPYGTFTVERFKV